ncbi:hypothetical protein C8Q74DRAFT_1451049 [Fomes fomentarius]|nr:hypothetical protein C8Q74DRAFT_1451049 [Fomes fomentarius]
MSAHHLQVHRSSIISTTADYLFHREADDERHGYYRHRMSVHRFLTNIDVLYAVFAHLDLFPRPVTASDFASVKDDIDYEARPIRSTLANAALTCRAFSEPASKTLWTCLHSHVGLKPLLKALNGFNENEEIGGEISIAAWQHFDRLASRVRYFATFGDLTPIELSVLDALVQHCQRKGHPLLPNLQILCWIESRRDPRKLQLLRLLSASPSLSLVSIKYFSKAMARDLAVITETHPDLPHLFAEGNQCLQTHSPILSLRFLKSLHVYLVDKPSFCQIGMFPYLTYLYAPVNRIRSVDVSRVSEGSFPSLRHFETSGDPATIIWTIKQISSPNLTSLSLVTGGKKFVQAPLETLFALPTVQSLQRLHLYIILYKLHGGKRNYFAFSDLAHCVLSLPRLEDVRLRVLHKALSLSHPDIVLIQSAWPCLRRLSLSFDTLEQESWQLPRPSLPALVDLALARPQLETLDVEVASVTEDDLIQLESKSISMASGPKSEHPTAFKLAWLTLARSKYYRKRITFPTDIPRLARALHRLFPMVGGLGRPVMKKYKDTMYDLWAYDEPRELGVFRLLEELEKLRGQRACLFFLFPQPDD